MSVSSNYDFPDSISYNTFDGIKFTLTKNGSPLTLTSASIVLKLNDSKKTEISTMNNGIQILDASNGIFQVNKQIMKLQPDTYSYELTYWLTDGTVKTFLSGNWTFYES